VTAGPCREPIDPVRFISNRSSGKMGFALAEAARDFGGEVSLVTGPVALNDPHGVETVRVETTEEMFKAVKKRFGKADILIMSAAPADFRPSEIAKFKIKKGGKNLSLSLQPTIDILKSLKEKRKKKQVVVGFALETDRALENASAKLKSKGLDLIVLNSMEDGTPFDSDTNKVTLLYTDGRKEDLGRSDKKSLAHDLIQRILDIKK